MSASADLPCPWCKRTPAEILWQGHKRWCTREYREAQVRQTRAAAQRRQSERIEELQRLEARRKAFAARERAREQEDWFKEFSRLPRSKSITMAPVVTSTTAKTTTTAARPTSSMSTGVDERRETPEQALARVRAERDRAVAERDHYKGEFDQMAAA